MVNLRVSPLEIYFNISLGDKQWIKDSVCKECGGTNWKAIIDSPGGEPKAKE